MELTLADRINRREWWHKPPCDPSAYLKRGIFLASSFDECFFHGRPLDQTVKVRVHNPIVNCEEEVISQLCGSRSPEMALFEKIKGLTEGGFGQHYKLRCELDQRLFEKAKQDGFDSIAIVARCRVEVVKRGRLPRSVELNVLYPTTKTDLASQLVGNPILSPWLRALKRSFTIEMQTAPEAAAYRQSPVWYAKEA